MLLLRSCALWLLLAALCHQVSASSGARTKSRGADQTVTPAPGRAQRSGGKKPSATGRGKFSIDEDKMQCAWVSKDASDAVRLSVKCVNREARVRGGITDIECEYNGKPQQCPSYQEDPKGFWKQVARALKKLQGKVCRDDRALVKAGACKRAPRDAHFKLDIRSSVVSAQSGEPEVPQRMTVPPHGTASSSVRPARATACPGRANTRRKAEEQCGSSWASVCNFFFSMLQSDEC